MVFESKKDRMGTIATISHTDSNVKVGTPGVVAGTSGVYTMCFGYFNLLK